MEEDGDRDPPEPRLDTIWTITRPTTSSIIAAVVSTLPRRVDTKLLVPRTVNVVPRLVEHSAAPAAKDCIGVASAMGPRMNDRPIGAAMPVMATHVERRRFAFKLLMDVDSPPVCAVSI